MKDGKCPMGCGEKHGDDDMQAKTIPDAIVLLLAERIEEQLVLETDCADFDAYKALPAAVIYQGVECGKTGWSSDSNRACYKQSAIIAHTFR